MSFFSIFSIEPCTAELFVSIFHSFEAGIANAISSFKWMKNNFIDISSFIKFSDISLDLKYA